jgi:hypothetical protein
VGDFSYVFSTERDKAGSYDWRGGNTNATTFVGVGLESWNTSAVTTLQSTFEGASSMNPDLGKWIVTKVQILWNTFRDASKFTGGGLDSWITTDVTTLYRTFYQASSMNANLGTWIVSKVQTLKLTFASASKFTGEGLESWNTSAVTTLDSTFDGASSMNADLGKWIVSKVKTLSYTFYGASKFKAVGLEKWTVTTAVSSTFSGAISIPACTKYRIYSDWSTDYSKVKTVYPNWGDGKESDKCKVR